MSHTRKQEARTWAHVCLMPELWLSVNSVTHLWDLTGRSGGWDHPDGTNPTTCVTEVRSFAFAPSVHVLSNLGPLPHVPSRDIWSWVLMHQVDNNGWLIFRTVLLYPFLKGHILPEQNGHVGIPSTLGLEFEEGHGPLAMAPLRPVHGPRVTNSCDNVVGWAIEFF